MKHAVYGSSSGYFDAVRWFFDVVQRKAKRHGTTHHLEGHECP